MNPDGFAVSPLPVPPVHPTGDPALDWIIFLVGYLAAIYGIAYWFKAAHLAREGILYVAQNVAWGIVAGVFVSALVQQTHPFDPSWKPLPWLAGFVVFLVKSNVARSRHIPAKVRRAVIERDLKGEPFDKNKHHIDHVWPFVLGGSHTVDNLRVIAKQDNQSKGKRRPKWREMFGE